MADHLVTYIILTAAGGLYALVSFLAFFTQRRRELIRSRSVAWTLSLGVGLAMSYLYQLYHMQYFHNLSDIHDNCVLHTFLIHAFNLWPIVSQHIMAGFGHSAHEFGFIDRLFVTSAGRFL